MNSKIIQFKKRNRRRNKHLYNEGLIKGIDYIICPVSNERLSMIKYSYITKVLGMSIEKYDKKYPGISKCCKKRGENLSKGLMIINPITGIKRSIEIQRKARITLSKVDEEGFTGDEKRAIKTKESNFKNIIDGKNGYQRTAEKARQKQIRTMSGQGKIARYDLRNKWEIYKKFVWYLTNKNRPVVDKNLEFGKGIGKYSLDHKISVCFGFNNNISPFLISNNSNMEYMKFEENSSKWTKCSITIDNLYKLSGYTKLKNEKEWNCYNKIVERYVKDKKLYSNEFMKKEILECISNY